MAKSDSMTPTDLDVKSSTPPIPSASQIVLAWSGGAEPRLLPRGHFLESVRREQLRAIRAKSKVSLVLVSIDRRYKIAFEDLYKLAKVLQAQVRETDLLGWYAENTLAVLLPDTDERGARECVERIQNHATSFPISCDILAHPKFPFFLGRSSSDIAPSTPLHESDPATFPRTQIVLKRMLDIFGALVGIALLSPIMIGAAIAVKATSKGPIIFKQVRLGRDGAPFIFLKFRSMRADADESVHREYVERLIASDSEDEGQGERKAWFKMSADARITPVGRFLRKTSIDELPQLFNVMKGDMSLVGPRPPIPYEVEAYSPWHLRRILEVKPGITGLWQVEGRGAISFDDMVRLDLRYARHWTILMDIGILLKTVQVVLQGRGAA